MVNETGAQYWRYTYQLSAALPAKHAEWNGSEVKIYAFSKEEAEKKIKEWFGDESPTFIERNPW